MEEIKKICDRCQAEKTIDQYYVKGTGRRTTCIACQQAAPRRCTKCLEVQPAESFHWARKDRVRATWCKSCTGKYKQEYLALNRDLVHRRDRQKHLYRYYRISLEDYDAMLARQGGACAFCGTQEAAGSKSPLCVDHCHDTGRVRGLLCSRCNGALGILGDSPKAILKVLQYTLGY